MNATSKNYLLIDITLVMFIVFTIAVNFKFNKKYHLHQICATVW